MNHVELAFERFWRDDVKPHINITGSHHYVVKEVAGIAFSCGYRDGCRDTAEHAAESFTLFEKKLGIRVAALAELKKAIEKAKP